MATNSSLAVLVVSPNAAVAADLAQMLRAASVEPVICPSPDAARAQARPRRAELAVIDMPGQTDTALLLIESLRSEGVASVLIGPANGQKLGLDRGAGPSAVLMRPFTSSHLACVLGVVQLAACAEAVVSTAARESLSAEMEERIRLLADLRPRSSLMCGAGGGAHCVYPGLELLSPREAEIARWLLQGQRVPAISRRLSISPHTVRNHIKAMFRKFGVHSQAELVDRLMGQRA